MRKPTIDEIKAKALHAARLLYNSDTVTDNAALIGCAMAELVGADPVAVREAIWAERPPRAPKICQGNVS